MIINFLDVRLLDWINKWPHFSWAEKLVLFLDAAGHLKIMLALAFILLALGLIKKNKRVSFGAIFLSLALTLSSVSVFILKILIHRPRPFLVHDGLTVLGHAYGGSFPSGHAALYGALGAFMIFYFRKFKAVWAGLILAAGTARIYQGVHYPSDVLAGWLVSFIVVMVLKSFLKSFFISFFKTNGL